jgi:hypothetical protein
MLDWMCGCIEKFFPEESYRLTWTIRHLQGPPKIERDLKYFRDKYVVEIDRIRQRKAD